MTHLAAAGTRPLYPPQHAPEGLKIALTSPKNPLRRISGAIRRLRLAAKRIRSEKPSFAGGV